MNALDTAALCCKLSCSARTLDRIIEDDQSFPKPFTLRDTDARLPPRHWRSDEIEAWIETRSHVARMSKAG
jgi:predicted DNA-binding transcriptional regulator AlpA